MRPLSVLCLAGVVLATSPALAAPVVESLSAETVAQSERFEILGSGFGEMPLDPAARVEIGGVTAATSTWTDDRIVAYASEGISLGAVDLRVVTADGASNAVPVTIDPPPAAQGAAWVFHGSAGAVTYKPTIAPDGTLYVSDGPGFIYAIAPSGVVRWIRHGPSAGATPEYSTGSASKGPIAVGADGTIYVSVDLLGPETQLQAWAPDGTLRWIHHEQNLFSHGPAVGPDGNVYFALRGPGGGVRILAPDGTLVGRHDERVVLDITGTVGEIVFDAGTDGGPIDRFYLASTQSEAGVDFSRGTLRAYALDGQLLWARDAAGTQSASGIFGFRDLNLLRAPNGRLHMTGDRYPGGIGVHGFEPDGEWVWRFPMPTDVEVSYPLSAPAVAPDGNLFAMNQHRKLIALDEDGTRLWVRVLEGTTGHAPVVHPSGSSVVVAMETEERVTLQAVDTDGRLGWSLEVPEIDGAVATPYERVVFTDDGGRGYLAARAPTNDPHWVLFAIDTPTDGGGGGGGAGGSGGTGGSSSGGSGGTGGIPDGNGGSGGTGGIPGGSGGTAGSAGGGGESTPETAGNGGCTSGASSAATALPLGALVSMLAWWRVAAGRRTRQGSRG